MSKINSPKLWQPSMWALALGIIALPATLQAQDKSAETEMIITKDQLSLTLNDAVRIALEKSPTLQATLLGIDGEIELSRIAVGESCVLTFGPLHRRATPRTYPTAFLAG